MSINPSDALNFPRAGDLRHRVTLLKSVRVPNDSGGGKTDWVPVAKVWANVRPLNPRELVNASQIDSRLTYEVTMYYRKGITPQMRILFRDHDLLIHGVLNQGEMDRTLICHCEDIAVRTGA